MDGFTYENTVGGWHVCEICGVRVSDPEKHTNWHDGLTELLHALMRTHFDGALDFNLGG